MSDNFYWILPDVDDVQQTIITPGGGCIVLRFVMPHENDPRIHIGQRYGDTFTWAQTRAAVEDACRACPDDVLIRGEIYSMAGLQFIEYVGGIERHDYSMIGHEFS